jgi:hypothetical protein
VRYELRPTGGGSFSTITTSTSSPFDGTWDTTGLASGSYDLRPVITDKAGNSYTGAVVTVTVNATAPSVVLADPGASVSGTITLSATVTGSGATGVTFSVSPAGANTWQTIGTDTSAPYSYAFNTATLADGMYDFRALVTDSFGNTSTSVRTNVRVDNTAPRVISSTPADGSTVSAASSIALVTSEAATPSGVTLDGASTVAPVVSGTNITYNTGALPYGLHVLAGTLTDSSGKSGPFRIAFTVWSGSGAPPVTQGNTSSSGSTTITSADGFATVTVPAGALPTSSSDWIVIQLTTSVNNTISNGFMPASEIVDVTAFWALSHQPVHRFNAPIDIVLHASGNQIVPATDDGFGFRVIRRIPSGTTLPSGWDDGFTALAGAYDVKTMHVTPFTLLKDVQPPSPPSHVRGTVAGGDVTLTWMPGADNSGTYDYVSVFVNGSPAGQFSPDTTTADLGPLDPNASIRLRETDLSGNTSVDTKLRAVPQLAGRQLDDVETALAAAGFRTGDLTEGTTGTVGTVTGPQNLAFAGEGDAIDLTVAPGTIAAYTKFLFGVVSAKKVALTAKHRALAVRILLTRTARVNGVLFSPSGVKLYTWRFSSRAGRSIVKLRLPSQVRRSGRYAIRWTARSHGETLTKTIRVRLIASGHGLPSVRPSTGPVEVVLAGSQIPQVSVGGKKKPKVVTADGVDNAFDLAGTGAGDVQVMVVDVDQFGVSFIRDLHTVFPSMKIIALSKSPKVLAAALKAGATVALPRSIPNSVLAAVVTRLLTRR